MTAVENALALLLWHLDASESELKSINVTRDDILRLARTFEAEIDTRTRDAMTDTGRALLVAYRHGQMDGPRSVAKADQQ